jgi:hypothetical protein
MISFGLSMGIVWGLIALLLIRNNWVFSTRIGWIYRDVHDFDKCVSYNRMMLKVWEWSRNPEKWRKV